MKNFVTFALAIAIISTALEAKSNADLSGFAIGNVLTSDTLPTLYDASNHIATDRNLQYIYDNPSVHNPFTTSWADALTSTNFDFVVVQPYLGTTLAQDAAVISQFMSMQPNAIFVVHTGWTTYANIETAYNDPQTALMQHSPAYFSALMGELRALNPGRDIRLNPAIEILESIRKDIVAHVGPYTAMSQLFKDTQHMSNADGRFLQNNLMRQTLGLEFSDVGFPAVVSAENQAYLLSKILEFKSVQAVPEPTSVVLFGSAAAIFGFRRVRQRRL